MRALAVALARSTASICMAYVHMSSSEIFDCVVCVERGSLMTEIGHERSVESGQTAHGPVEMASGGRQQWVLWEHV
jgi:hypothetical protein